MGKVNEKIRTGDQMTWLCWVQVFLVYIVFDSWQARFSRHCKGDSDFEFETSGPLPDTVNLEIRKR